MPAVIVRLDPQEYECLDAMATRQTREPDQQATYLIRRALARQPRPDAPERDTQSRRVTGE